jgi:hypothetical protein
VPGRAAHHLLLSAHSSPFSPQGSRPGAGSAGVPPFTMRKEGLLSAGTSNAAVRYR